MDDPRGTPTPECAQVGGREEQIEVVCCHLKTVKQAPLTDRCHDPFYVFLVVRLVSSPYDCGLSLVWHVDNHVRTSLHAPLLGCAGLYLCIVLEVY